MSQFRISFFDVRGYALAQFSALAVDLKRNAEEQEYARRVAILDELAKNAQPNVASADVESCRLEFKRLELQLFEELTIIQDAAATSDDTQKAGTSDIAWLFRHWNAERVFADLARLSEIAQ